MSCAMNVSRLRRPRGVKRYSRPRTVYYAAPVSRRSRCSDIGAARPHRRWQSSGPGSELPVPLAAPALDRAMRSTEPPPGSTSAHVVLYRRSDQKRKPMVADWTKTVGADWTTDYRQV